VSLLHLSDDARTHLPIPFSSGDSMGASVAQQKANYDTVTSQSPSTILTLNHETYGKPIDLSARGSGSVY